MSPGGWLKNNTKSKNECAVSMQDTSREEPLSMGMRLEGEYFDRVRDTVKDELPPAEVTSTNEFSGRIRESTMREWLPPRKSLSEKRTGSPLDLSLEEFMNEETEQKRKALTFQQFMREEAAEKNGLADMYPAAYFFYGTWTNTKNLKRMLGLSVEPQVKEARIVGFERVRYGSNWNVVAKDESEVQGVVYMVLSRAEDAMVSKSKGTTWRPVTVNIEIHPQGTRRGEMIEGKMFLAKWDTNISRFSDLSHQRQETTWKEELKGRIRALSDNQRQRRSAPMKRVVSVEKSPVKVYIPSGNPGAVRATGSLDTGNPWAGNPFAFSMPRRSQGRLPRAPSVNLGVVPPRPPTYCGLGLQETMIMLRTRAPISGCIDNDRNSFELDELRHSVQGVGEELRDEIVKTNTSAKPQMDTSKALPDLPYEQEGELMLDPKNDLTWFHVQLREKPLPPVPEGSSAPFEIPIFFQPKAGQGGMRGVQKKYPGKERLRSTET